MAVRNCAEIGENLQKIVTRLMANDDLVNLLYYSDKEPLDQPHLSQQEKKEKIYEELIKVIPQVSIREDDKSVIVIRVLGGIKDPGNSDFRNVRIAIETYVPLTAWIFKSTNLRPFAILGEIEKSLQGKKINGLGTIIGGDFELKLLTKEISVYQQIFQVTIYE